MCGTYSISNRRIPLITILNAYSASMSGTQTRRHAISHSHILNAFSQTKPSLSAEDLRFYNSIYSQFKPDRSLSASHHSHSITTEDSVVPQQRMSLK